MKKKELLCPSGVIVVIREATGSDDDIFSGGTAKDYELLNRYLAAIIIEGPEPGSMTAAKVAEFPLRDKYFILLASRIFSLSPTLIFQYTWGEGMVPIEYEIDLEEYLWDYKEDFPLVGTPGYFDQRIPPYPSPFEEWIEIDLGERRVRLNYLTGVGEAYMLELPEAQKSINKQLVARNLSLFENNSWHIVKNFMAFTSREMVTIRLKLQEVDPEVSGLVTITNPNTGEIENISLLGIVDFFFPTKI